jgi:predicted nucleic acid-binding protein
MVIDTSALLAVILQAPERPALIAATAGAVLVAPGSLPWEVGNALVSLVRRRRLTADDAAQAWAAYETVPLRLLDVDIRTAVRLAMELGLYAYDAYMLILAQQRGLPLLTLDIKLQTAARRTGVSVVEI